MEHAGLVSPIDGNVDWKSSSASKTKGYFQISFRQTSISDEQFNKASGMAYLRKTLVSQEFNKLLSSLWQG